MIKIKVCYLYDVLINFFYVQVNDLVLCRVHYEKTGKGGKGKGQGKRKELSAVELTQSSYDVGQPELETHFRCAEEMQLVQVVQPVAATDEPKFASGSSLIPIEMPLQVDNTQRMEFLDCDLDFNLDDLYFNLDDFCEVPPLPDEYYSPDIYSRTHW